ncbi:hypothetical protein [Prescottella equi]|uniref:Uncharacterized protein n=1 Tax=Prescottella equi ATCC 33707 TaxID=525370 RepID=E9T0M2_RHOHA|nr:hypothetical protein [Prescottella equi]EGD23973.1 hypothetical protein HMPREF0724_12181 [Prescottella equi ATCC 33707]
MIYSHPANKHIARLEEVEAAYAAECARRGIAPSATPMAFGDDDILLKLFKEAEQLRRDVAKAFADHREDDQQK